MSRYRREVAIGVPHHIAHRGNHQAPLFESEEDFRYYLSLLHRFSRLHELKIAGFCLMTNHIHLIAIPERLKSLARCMGVVQRMYSEHLNRRRNSHGSNWEGRYYSVQMEPLHTLNALRYIERNPVEARMVSDPSDWMWSSAAYHSGMGKRWSVLNADVRPVGTTETEWKRLLRRELTEMELQHVRWAALSMTSTTCVAGGQSEIGG
jgi:putative transposase